MVPTHVKGRLSGGDPAGHQLAMALNGRIVAVGESFANLGSTSQPRDLVPDTKLRRGRNALVLYEVRGGQLTKLAQAG